MSGLAKLLLLVVLPAVLVSESPLLVLVLLFQNATLSQLIRNVVKITTTKIPKTPTKTIRLFGELIHYDFYRLDDPGLMSEDLLEAISDPLSVVVIEWGNDVSSMLPESHYRLEFSLNPDGSRKIKNNFSRWS